MYKRQPERRIPGMETQGYATCLRTLVYANFGDFNRDMDAEIMVSKATVSVMMHLQRGRGTSRTPFAEAKFVE